MSQSSKKALALLFLGLLMLLTAPMPAMAQGGEPWPTTKFEVIPGPPIARNWGEGELASYMDLVLPVFGDDFAFIDEMEEALSRAARHYQAMGFSEPLLEPLVTLEDGSLAYRVFICKQSWLDKLEDKAMAKWHGNEEMGSMPVQLSIPGLPTLRSIWERCSNENAAAHMGRCGTEGGFRNYIYINREKRFTNPTMGFWDYEVLAHELFHAVQGGSAWGDHSSPCKTGSWISEGMADAIAGDFAREEWKGAPNFMPNRNKEYGIRSYADPLATRQDEFVYQTSSFWRHVAEWYHAAVSNAGRRVGSAKTKTNYGYLVHLLKQRMTGAEGPRRELRWLDESLRSTPRLTTNLARIYAEFIASFADQFRTRIASEAERQSKSELDRYLRFIFGGSRKKGSTGNPCPKITLSPSEPVQAQYFVLNEVAARCFELTVFNAYGPSQPGQVVVTLSTGPTPRYELTPLWVGKAGGMEVSQFNLFTTEDRDEAPGYGTVQFRVPTGEPTVFAVSNIAHYAQNSKLLTPTLTFLLDGWDSSLTKPPPAQKAPVRPKSGQRPSDVRGQHEAALDEQFEQGLGRLTPNGLGSTGLSRNFGEFGRCEGDRKRYNLCGPQLEITLELVSEAAASVATSTSGGFFNQMRAGGMGRISEMSLPELMALKDSQEEMSPKFIEGGRINITIPRIDYGFKGSFDHAVMTVSKEGGGIYAATTSSPVSVNTGGLGGPTLRRVPNGKVIIEEYTPFVLRGSFEASLVERRNDLPVPPNESVPLVNQVSGSFSIANPFHEDNRYRADESTFRQQMGLDVLDNPAMSDDGPLKPSSGFSPDEIRALCEMGIDSHLLEGMGITGGCSGGEGSRSAQEELQCRCDCDDFQAGIHEQCVPRCGEIYAHCGADRLSPDELSALRARLASAEMPEMMIDQYMGMLESMSVKEQQEFIEVLDVIVENMNF